MNSKKKRVLITSTILGLIAGALVVFSVIGGYKMTESSEKDSQIAFLKEHETEMTEYIKSQNSKITSVQYDWDSVKVNKIGNGIPMGAGEVLIISGKFNNISNSSFYLQFGFDKESRLPVIDKVTSYGSFRIAGMLYE